MQLRFQNVTAVLMLAALAACDYVTPTEVRTDGSDFPVSATWQASATPVGASPVSATLNIQQRLGFRMDVTLNLTGASNASYQWRIFRGDCATNVAAANNTAPTGLLLFATLQSYPDAAASAAGSVSITTAVAGSLDSQTAYSIRVRASQASTSWNGTNPIACGNLQRSGAG